MNPKCSTGSRRPIDRVPEVYPAGDCSAREFAPWQWRPAIPNINNWRRGTIRESNRESIRRLAVAMGTSEPQILGIVGYGAPVLDRMGPRSVALLASPRSRAY